MTITKSGVAGPGTGKTKLDKERMKLCQRDVVSNHAALYLLPLLLWFTLRNLSAICPETCERLSPRAQWKNDTKPHRPTWPNFDFSLTILSMLCLTFLSGWLRTVNVSHTIALPRVTWFSPPSKMSAAFNAEKSKRLYWNCPVNRQSGRPVGWFRRNSPFTYG